MLRVIRQRSLIISLLALTLYSPLVNANDGDWQFEITPYIWVAGLDGSTVVDGVSSNIENDYEFFILENLDVAGAVAFEARKNRWASLLDGLYVKYSDDFNNRFFDTDFSTSGGFIEAAVSYQVKPDSNLEVLAGLRHISVDVDLELTPGPDVSGGKTWTDPLIGLRYKHPINDKWSAQFRGDIGGGNSADFVSNVTAGVEYKFTESTNLKLGYRHMKIDFDRDNFIYDVTLSGVVVGLGIKF